MESMLIIWLVLIAVFVAVEIATLGLTTVWFAAGSLVAFIAGFFICRTTNILSC